MRIICLANLCGQLPKVTHHDAEIAVIAGDTCNNNMTYKQQMDFMNEAFLDWIANLYTEKRLLIAGEKDDIFTVTPNAVKRQKWSSVPTYNYLYESGCKVKDKLFFGSPWSVGTKMMQSCEEILEHTYEQFPKNIDVLISHSPPYEIGDLQINEDGTQEHLGSRSLRQWILEYQPKAVICGHVPDGYGLYKLDNTLIVNACITKNNQVVNEPIIIDI